MKSSTQSIPKPLKVILIETGYQREVLKNILIQTNLINIYSCLNCITELNLSQIDEEIGVVIINAMNPELCHLDELNQLNALKTKPIIIAITRYDYIQYVTPLMSYNINKCISADKIPSIGSLVLELSSVNHNYTYDSVLNLDDIKLLNLICYEMCNENIAEKLFISIEALKKRKLRLSNKLHIQNNDKSFMLWARSNGYF